LLNDNIAIICNVAQAVIRRRNAYVSTAYLRLIIAAVVSKGLLFVDIMVCWYLNSKPLRQDRITTMNVCLRRRRGGLITLDDGSMVNRNDLILEIHLNNHWFLCNKDMLRLPGRAGREFLTAFSEDLKYLAEQVVNETINPEIKAIHGRTLLRQAQGNQLLGFTVTNIPDSPWKLLSQLYLGNLRQAYYPNRARRSLARAKPLEKKEIWMSRKKLLNLYGPSMEISL
jgi:hypothetical protein